MDKQDALRYRVASLEMKTGEFRKARLLSVNVGLPRDIAWRGQTVRTCTGYLKQLPKTWRV